MTNEQRQEALEALDNMWRNGIDAAIQASMHGQELIDQLTILCERMILERKKAITALQPPEPVDVERLFNQAE